MVDDPAHRFADLYRRGYAPPRGSRDRVWCGVQAETDVAETCRRARRTLGAWLSWSVGAAAAAAALVLWLGGRSTDPESRPVVASAHERRGANRSVPISPASTPGDRATPQPEPQPSAIARAAVVAFAPTGAPPTLLLVAILEGRAEPPGQAGPRAPTRTRRRTPAAPVAPIPPTGAAATGPPIAGLVAVLEQVDASLRHGDPAGALTLLDRHRAALLRAGLGPEHDAFELVAQCTLNPGADRQRAMRFADHHPDSLYAARIAAACRDHQVDKQPQPDLDAVIIDRRGGR